MELVIFATQSFNNSRAAMPNNNGCQGFFYALTQAVCSISKERVCYTPCLSVMGKRSLETGTLQRVSVANPLFFRFTPKGHDTAKHLQSAMVSKNNCPATTPDSPAQAVTPQTPNPAQEFINAWLEDPEFVHVIRRDLRTWFTNNLIQWDERFGSRLATQILNYEILDELPSLLIANPPTQQK